MVLTIFDKVRGLVKLNKFSIDNDVFLLHYKVTVLFLLIFAILATSTQLFGKPIECFSSDDSSEMLTKIQNSYCWMQNTYSLPKDAQWKKVQDGEVPYPGIENYQIDEKRFYHSYYQFVGLVLFLQAAFFYIPRFLWKSWEGGLVESLVLGLDKPIQPPKQRKEEMKLLLEYFKSNLKTHNRYFCYFVFCEMLNLLIVLVQMFFIDRFLGGTFSTYGLKVLRYFQLDQDDRVDPMVAVFPRLVKCIYHLFGPGGQVEKRGLLCTLPLNTVNEKVYIFLWFWLLFLTAITITALVYRLLTVLIKEVRKAMLRWRCSRVDDFHLNVVLNASNPGDWFLLTLLAKNMYTRNFVEFMKCLSEHILIDRQNVNLDH